MGVLNVYAYAALVVTLSMGTRGAKWVHARDRLEKFMLDADYPSLKRDVFMQPRDVLQLTADESLEVTDRTVSIENTEVTRYTEAYMGIPIYDVIITIETDLATGQYTGQATGKFMQGIENEVLNTTPTLSADEAVAIAKANFSIDESGSPTAYRSVSVVLRIALLGNVTTLVYDVSYFVQSRERKARPAFFVDANSGHILRKWNKLKNHRLSGIGGNLKTGKYIFGKDYPYLNVHKKDNNCWLENDEVRVFNLKAKTVPEDANAPFSFSCDKGSDDSANGAFSPANDAFYFATETLNMYQEWINVKPLQFPIDLWVHYGLNEVDAFYDGGIFAFGDGDGKTTYPLVSADVIAHEITHAFTEQHSGLEYEGQSGSIDEAFADLAGEAFEFYTFGQNDWLAGKAIDVKSAFRDICDQSKDRHSIINAKDYDKDLDVHHTSGVYNNVICILSKSENWNVKKAFQTFAHADRFYWHPTSGFDDAACGVLKATYDLGFEIEHVLNAFERVNIKTCDISGYIRSLPPDARIENLKAESGEEIILKIRSRRRKGYLKIVTTGGNGDVDLYLGFRSALRPKNAKLTSTNKGNNEIIKVRLKNKFKAFILLKPKTKRSFSGVTISTKVSS